MTQVFGIILAGGLARRMGGIDKALLPLKGETNLARLARRLGPQCAGLVLNANGDLSRFAGAGLAMARDDVPGFAGPNAGVLAGLTYVAATAPDIAYAVSVPVDTPFVPADLVARLLAARAEAGAEIAVAASGGRVHPAVALWPVALRDALRKALVEEDLRKVLGFIERFRHVVVDWPTTPWDPFFNVNRPEDVLTAAEIISQGG